MAAGATIPSQGPPPELASGEPGDTGAATASGTQTPGSQADPTTETATVPSGGSSQVPGSQAPGSQVPGSQA